MNTNADRKKIINTLADIKTATQQERLSYGGYVKQLRESLNLNQAELAEAANTTARTVGNIERQAHAGQADVLIRIFRALGIELENKGWSTETEHYLAMIAPLIERIHPRTRPKTMTQVIDLLSDAIANDPNVRPQGDNIDPVETFDIVDFDSAKHQYGLAANNDEEYTEQ